jgi:hypothetical protein
VTPPVANWDFGFIQFAQVDSMEFIYRGRISPEGSVGIKVDAPPALTQRVALDPGQGTAPWTAAAGKRFTNVNGQITAPTGDHPISFTSLTTWNPATNTLNFLFQINDERQFWCVFTAQDPSGHLHFLAHFHISVSWGARVTWLNGAPIGHLQSDSKFDPGKVVMGPPKEPALQGLLANAQAVPADQFFNALLAQAFSQMGSAGPPNRFNDAVDRFSGGGFWQ